jgi:biopolymer transport protein ExbD
MDLNWHRSFLAVPLASLFLILVLCVFGTQRQPSAGFRIPMIQNPDKPRHDCSDPNRTVFFRLTRDGTIWLNSTRIPPERLTKIVDEIMENRGDRILYVVADPEISYVQFVNFLDRVSAARMNLHVALLTDKLRESLEQDRGQAFCELEWPENEPSSMPAGSIPPLHTWH